MKSRQRESLRRSLANPYPDASKLAEVGFDEWAAGFPGDEAEGLVDPLRGSKVRWLLGRGWVADSKEA